MRRIDGERHQDREDLCVEVVVELRAVVLAEIRPRDHVDARLGERGPHQLRPRIGVADLQRVGLGRDVGENLVRSASHVRRHRESRDDAALEAGDADHEELVEVAGEDREEVRPLEHRKRLVFGELEDPVVEGQPAQLAVEVAVVGELRVERLRQVEVVVVRVTEPRVQHLLFDHPLIIAG